MSESRVRSEREPPTGETDKQGKKPYRKPTFRHERVFETMALACGKISPTQAQCFFNRKVS
jgi:hypothetical protein